MKEILEMNASEVSMILEAAKIWFRTQNERSNFRPYEAEQEMVERLQKEWWKTAWDDDAELILIEKPF